MGNNSEEQYLKIITKLVRTIILLVVLILGLVIFSIYSKDIEKYFADAPKRKTQKITEQIRRDSLRVAFEKEDEFQKEYSTFWKANDINNVTDSTAFAALVYGRDLIAHTAKYFGPKGAVLKMSNGMNCQNCHLDAGTKPWGNNYGAVFSTYPKYRARSGTQEDIYKRINDCFERSLNGKALDTASREMQAIKSYIEFIGSNVSRGEKTKASGIYELPFLDRACNPNAGKILYAAKCASCHQADGQGQLALDSIEYTYPPLWGSQSYNNGAGLFRLSRFAGFIKYNMPQGATYQYPQLTNEEAWDIAAFVNSQPRPAKNLSMDWPNISEKPVDHPFCPFADLFTELQHKYGPYQIIKDEQKKRQELNKSDK